jgi:hypothetical protein
LIVVCSLRVLMILVIVLIILYKWWKSNQ